MLLFFTCGALQKREFDQLSAHEYAIILAFSSAKELQYGEHNLAFKTLLTFSAYLQVIYCLGGRIKFLGTVFYKSKWE